MHIVFLNPQGNFDPSDSYLAEHPDFGGQLVYVKEVAQAMVELGHRVDIVTRRVRDNAWPEFAADQDTYAGFERDLRILRFPCGGDEFLAKENLWPHLPELIKGMLNFYGDQLPDCATAHYADGGYCGILTLIKTGVPFIFTGHSLGAQKLDKLGIRRENWHHAEARYKFSCRIDAERASMWHASRIIVSTSQEKSEQYAHPLYKGAVDASEDSLFAITSPGVNTHIFRIEPTEEDKAVRADLTGRFADEKGPVTLVSSRLDEKKNIIGVVKAYANSKELQKNTALVLSVRGIEIPERDIKKLSESEQAVLREILTVIKEAQITEKVYFLNIRSQRELAATYRYFAERGSVFALTSFYEPFGLAPIEAAASGLAPVVTNKGGPKEIFADGSGILVDPFLPEDIARGLLDGFKRHKELSAAAIRRVKKTYTWQQTAQGYIAAIEQVLANPRNSTPALPIQLDATPRITDYLEV